jgi:hypothetical protein
MGEVGGRFPIELSRARRHRAEARRAHPHGPLAASPSAPSLPSMPPPDRTDSLLLERLVPEARHLGSSRPVRRYARRPRALRERRPGVTSPRAADSAAPLLPREAAERLRIQLPVRARSRANLAALEAELFQLKPFPARVNVETTEGDAFERLSAVLNELRRDRAQMAPAFLFVDPYGFKIPAGLLALEEIFGSGSWRTEVIGDGMDERLDARFRSWREVSAPSGGRRRCEWSRVDKRRDTCCSI